MLTGVIMSNLIWLTDEQMDRLRPFFPKSHGKPRVDDRRVLSGIIFINRNGLRWCDAPREYGPPKTLYNRWKRWGDMVGVAHFVMKDDTLLRGRDSHSPENPGRRRRAVRRSCIAPCLIRRVLAITRSNPAPPHAHPTTRRRWPVVLGGKDAANKSREELLGSYAEHRSGSRFQGSAAAARLLDQGGVRRSGAVEIVRQNPHQG